MKWGGLYGLTLGALVAAAPVRAADPVAFTAAPTTYRLLHLDSELARWRPQGRDRVVVTYAFIDHVSTFRGARNCPGMQPLDELAARNGMARAQVRQEMTNAARRWEAVANIRFVEVDDPSAARLLIGAQTEPVGRAFTNVELTPPADGTPRLIARSLICLNPEKRWKVGFDGDLDAYDLSYTFTHELGHAIGLDHPQAKNQLMGYRYTEAFAGLQAGDIAGAVAIYGRPQQEPQSADNAVPLSASLGNEQATSAAAAPHTLALGTEPR